MDIRIYCDRCWSSNNKTICPVRCHVLVVNKYFEIDKYFILINGSPIKKDILIQNIIKDFGYNKDEVILIGDSMIDYNAAKKNEIRFYGYNNIELKKYGDYIKKFQDIRL